MMTIEYDETTGLPLGTLDEIVEAEVAQKAQVDIFPVHADAMVMNSIPDDTGVFWDVKTALQGTRKEQGPR